VGVGPATGLGTLVCSGTKRGRWRGVVTPGAPTANKRVAGNSSQGQLEGVGRVGVDGLRLVGNWEVRNA
jgi:hypothetical protein